MYSNYKPSLAKQLTKAKQAKANKQQEQKPQKVAKVKPEWNDAVADKESYKLSTSEIIQKKASLMSKHRLEAKEQWMETQEKLKNGVIDDETKKIYDTARQSKNLSTRDDDVQRKNLSQMLNFIPKPSKSVVQEIKNNLKDTRKFIEKAEQFQNDEDPNRLLRAIDRISKTSNNNHSNISNKNEGKTTRRSASSFEKDTKRQDIQSQRETIFSQNTQEQETDKNEDINSYFTSLGKIEETIKFMEERILCEKKSKDISKLPENKGKELFQQNQRNFEKQQNEVKLEEEFKKLNTHLNSSTGSHKLSRKNSRNFESDGVSFDLTEGDEDYEYDQRQQSSKVKQIATNFAGQDENEVAVNDFHCQINTIDPNLFFDDQENQDNNSQTPKGSEQQFKSEYQTKLENQLSKPSNLPFKDNYEFLAKQKLEQMNMQNAQSEKQYPSSSCITSNINKLKQQQEDDYLYEYDYKNKLKNQDCKKSPEKIYQNNFPIAQKYVPQKPYEQDKEEGEDDILSKNIDSIKDLLEATRKDLEKLDYQGTSTQYDKEQNYSDFGSTSYKTPEAWSQTNQQKPFGRKITDDIQIVSKIPNLDSIKKATYENQNNNNLQVNENEKNRNIESIRSSAFSHSNNNFNNSKAFPEVFTSNLFLQNNSVKQNSIKIQDEYQQNLSSQSTLQTGPFTSNLFLNGANNNNQIFTNTRVHSSNEQEMDAPQQLKIVKQDLFKKSLQTFCISSVNPQDSLNIKHHLR